MTRIKAGLCHQLQAYDIGLGFMFAAERQCQPIFGANPQCGQYTLFGGAVFPGKCTKYLHAALGGVLK